MNQELERLVNQAGQLCNQQRYRQAEPLCIKAVNIKVEKEDGPTHLMARFLLAQAYSGQGRTAEEDKTYQSILDELTTYPDDWMEATVLQSYIQFSLRQKNDAKAIALAEQFLSRFPSQFQKRNCKITDLTRIASNLEARRLDQEADKFYKLALDSQTVSGMPKRIRIQEEVSILTQWAPSKIRRDEGADLISYVDKNMADIRGEPIYMFEMHTLQRLLLELTGSSKEKAAVAQSKHEVEKFRNQKTDETIKLVEHLNRGDANVENRISRLAGMAMLHLQKHDLNQAQAALKEAVDLYRSAPTDRRINLTASHLAQLGSRLAAENEQRGNEYWDEIISLAIEKNNDMLLDLSMNDLDRYYKFAKKVPALELFYRNLLQQQEQRTGIDSLQTVRFHKRLKDAYDLDKRYSDALTEQQKVCSLEEQFHAPQAISDSIVLAEAYVRAGKPDLAKQIYAKAIESAKASKPSDDGSYGIIFSALTSLSKACSDNQIDRDSDIALLDSQYFRMNNPRWGRRDPYVINDILRKVDKYVAQGKYSSAEFLLANLISMIGADKENTSQIVNLQGRLADVYAYEEKFSKSYALFKKAYAEIVKNAGPDSPQAKNFVARRVKLPPDFKQ